MPFALHRPPSFVIVLRMARLKTSARKTSPATDVLLMATPTKNADLRWFSGFHASDPFPAFSIGGRKVGLLPLLEVGRAKQESALDEVLNLTRSLLGNDPAKAVEKGAELIEKSGLDVREVSGILEGLLGSGRRKVPEPEPGAAPQPAVPEP